VAIAFVSQGVNSGNLTGVPVTITPTAGNILIACINLQSTSTARTVSSISQTNVTWTLLKRTVNGLTDCEVWKGVVGASPGASATVNTSGTFTDMSVNVSQFSGVTGTSDFTAGGTTGSSVTPSTGAYTTITANDLVIVAVAFASNAFPSAHPAGFTALTRENISTCTLEASYQLTQAAGLKAAATWTITSSIWATAVIGLQGSAPTANWLDESYWWQRSTESSGIF
jgi:hypothetical protein